MRVCLAAEAGGDRGWGFVALCRESEIVSRGELPSGGPPLHSAKDKSLEAVYGMRRALAHKGRNLCWWEMIVGGGGPTTVVSKQEH